MLKTFKLFTLLASLLIVLISGFLTAVSAQTKNTYVGSNGTVYSNYRGAGEVKCADYDDESVDTYCYQCRSFHKRVVVGCNHQGACEGGKCKKTDNCGEKACGGESCHSEKCEGHGQFKGEACEGYSHYRGEGCTGHKHLNNEPCGDCKGYTADMYDMDHDYDHYDKDYIVKYRGNKVKVKCNGCNAKWKYYYNDSHGKRVYLYDNNNRVITSYAD